MVIALQQVLKGTLSHKVVCISLSFDAVVIGFSFFNIDIHPTPSSSTMHSTYCHLAAWRKKEQLKIKRFELDSNDE